MQEAVTDLKYAPHVSTTGALGKPLAGGVSGTDLKLGSMAAVGHPASKIPFTSWGLAFTFPASVPTDRTGNWNPSNGIGSLILYVS